jgi:hypothetical protein
MKLSTRLLLPLGGAVLALFGMTTFAVSTGRAQQRSAPTVEQAYAAAQTAQLALAVYQMDNAGLHDLDEATHAGRIPSGALGRVRRVRIVAAAVSWPEEMQAKAREFVEHAMALERALEAEDAAVAAPDAEAVHDLGHELSNMVYAMLARQAGTTAPDNH